MKTSKCPMALLLFASFSLFNVLSPLARAESVGSRNEELCDSKIGVACFEVGYAFAKGLGGAKDVEKAIIFYEKACSYRMGDACFYLGVAYEHGEGIVQVAQDLEQAAVFYQAACDAGVPEGCFSLGNAYSNGEGREQDQAQAATLYQKACDAWSTCGCFNLGYAYAFKGLGPGLKAGESTISASVRCWVE